MRKLAPLTSGLYNVQHGVRQFALAPLPIPHSRIVRSDFFPLSVCQVRRVRLAHLLCFFQAAIITHLSYKGKFWFCRTSTYNTAWKLMRTILPAPHRPLRPSDAQQEHISGLRRIVANRNSRGCCILSAPLYTKSRQMESALL